MRHLLISVLLMAVFVSNSQSLTPKEIRNLSDRIMKPLSLNDSLDPEDHKAEYIQVVLRVDSLGKISSMHVLTDPGNIGSLYKAVSGIPISVFDGWIEQKVMQRTIVFPIVYMPSDGCPEYILDLVNSRGDKSIYHKIISETATTISLTAYPFSKPEIKF
jgi:hypothetical protein